jgi:hypothetical protein
MSTRAGVTDTSIRVTRINSKILHHPRLYLLPAAARVKHKYPYSQFNFPKYFEELSSREECTIEPVFLEFCAPANFVRKYSDMLDVLHRKYGAWTVYYDPLVTNYYHGCVWGFLFDDAKRQLMFELAHNDLRASARNYPET